MTTDRRSVARTLKIGITAVFILVIALYSYNRSRNLIAGPSIVIEYPASGFVATSTLLELRGIAKNISSLTLNDRAIFTDEQGVFRDVVALSEGYNPIEVSARDRFGRTVSEVLYVTYVKQ